MATPSSSGSPERRFWPLSLAMRRAFESVFGTKAMRKQLQDPTESGTGLLTPVIYIPSRVLNCGAGRAPGSWCGQLHDIIRIRQQVQTIITSDSKKRMMEPYPWFEFNPIRTPVVPLNGKK